MRARWLLLCVVLEACGRAVPDPCDAMCVSAEVLYGGCLESWGASWSAAGYEDGADFRDACSTWAWEMRLLEADAGLDGEVDATCEERTAAFTGGTCEAYTQIDWNVPPWEEE